MICMGRSARRMAATAQRNPRHNTAGDPLQPGPPKLAPRFGGRIRFEIAEDFAAAHYEGAQRTAAQRHSCFLRCENVRFFRP